MNTKFIRDYYLSTLLSFLSVSTYAHTRNKQVQSSQALGQRKAAQEKGFSQLLNLLGMLTERIVEEKQRARVAEVAAVAQVAEYKRDLKEQKVRQADATLERLLGVIDARGYDLTRAREANARAKMMKIVEA